MDDDDDDDDLFLECDRLNRYMDDIMTKYCTKTETDDINAQEERVRRLLLRKTCLFAKWILPDIRKIDEYETLTFNDDSSLPPIAISDCGYGADGVDERSRCYEAKTSEFKVIISRNSSSSMTTMKKKNNASGRCNFSWPIPSTRAALIVSVFEKTGNRSLFVNNEDDDAEKLDVFEKAKRLVSLFIFSPPNEEYDEHDERRYGMAIYTLKSKQTRIKMDEFRYSCGFLMRYFFYLPLPTTASKKTKTDLKRYETLESLESVVVDEWLSNPIATRSHNFGCERCLVCGSFHRLKYLQELDISTRKSNTPLQPKTIYESFYNVHPSQCRIIPQEKQ